LAKIPEWFLNIADDIFQLKKKLVQRWQEPFVILGYDKEFEEGPRIIYRGKDGLQYYTLKKHFPKAFKAKAGDRFKRFIPVYKKLAPEEYISFYMYSREVLQEQNPFFPSIKYIRFLSDTNLEKTSAADLWPNVLKDSDLKLNDQESFEKWIMLPVKLRHKKVLDILYGAVNLGGLKGLSEMKWILNVRL